MKRMLQKHPYGGLDIQPELIQEELEENMDVVRDIIEACARARDLATI